MLQWEYLLHKTAGAQIDIKHLTDLGSQGWEMVSITPVVNAPVGLEFVFMFKRPKVTSSKVEENAMGGKKDPGEMN